MMSSILVQGLAVWVVSRYATREKISDPWRAWLAVRKPTARPAVKQLIALITCTVCLGQWISFAVTAWQFGAPWSWSVSVWVLAFAANAVTLVGEGFVDSVAAFIVRSNATAKYYKGQT